MVFQFLADSAGKPAFLLVEVCTSPSTIGACEPEAEAAESTGSLSEKNRLTVIQFALVVGLLPQRAYKPLNLQFLTFED